MKKEIRYELEVGGAKGYLAPLSFPVVEAALGFVFKPMPKYLTAGAVILNSLWVKGSPKLKEGGEDYNEACKQAYAAVESIEYSYKDGVIEIPYTGKGKDQKPFTKVYKCTINETIDRDTLELCMALIRPHTGNAKALTAGYNILEKNWVDGDDEIKKIDELKIAASTACYHLVNMKGSSLKKV